MENSLVLCDVNKKYSGYAMHNVSFSLPGGCIMGLIGENGAGKTTLIKLILNLIGRDSGSITVFGLDNIRDELKMKEGIGVVFDDSSFHQGFSAREIGKISSFMFGNWDAMLFNSYLKQWAIPEKKNISQLSKGMKMKLSIAAALSHRPRLLILDEATGGLDPVMRGEVLDVFRDFIADEAHSILFSTHITSDLEHIADYITFLHAGKVQFCAQKDALLETYGIARCGRNQGERIPSELVAGERRSEFGRDILVRDRSAVRRRCPDLTLDKASLEDIMTLTIKGVNA